MHAAHRPVSRAADRAFLEVGPPRTAGLRPRSNGEALAAPVRTRFERRFGTSLAGVRVHVDAEAAASAAALDAQAYTIGRDVFFAAGRFRPFTAQGERLLAHELAHAVQQRGDRPFSGMLAISRPGDRAEREADRAADAVASGHAVRLAAGSEPLAIHRQGLSHGPPSQRRVPWYFDEPHWAFPTEEEEEARKADEQTAPSDAPKSSAFPNAMPLDRSYPWKRTSMFGRPNSPVSAPNVHFNQSPWMPRWMSPYAKLPIAMPLDRSYPWKRTSMFGRPNSPVSAPNVHFNQFNQSPWMPSWMSRYAKLPMTNLPHWSYPGTPYSMRSHQGVVPDPLLHLSTTRDAEKALSISGDVVDGPLGSGQRNVTGEVEYNSNPGRFGVRSAVGGEVQIDPTGITPTGSFSIGVGNDKFGVNVGNDFAHMYSAEGTFHGGENGDVDASVTAAYDFAQKSPQVGFNLKALLRDPFQRKKRRRKKKIDEFNQINGP